MNDVKTLLQAAHADAVTVREKIDADFQAAEATYKAARAMIEQHIASIVAALGFDPATLELTDVQPADQAAA